MAISIGQRDEDIEGIPRQRKKIVWFWAVTAESRHGTTLPVCAIAINGIVAQEERLHREVERQKNEPYRSFHPSPEVDPVRLPGVPSNVAGPRGPETGARRARSPSWHACVLDAEELI